MISLARFRREARASEVMRTRRVRDGQYMSSTRPWTVTGKCEIKDADISTCQLPTAPHQSKSKVMGKEYLRGKQDMSLVLVALVHGSEGWILGALHSRGCQLFNLDKSSNSKCITFSVPFVNNFTISK